jgi:hypothetical protein
MKQVSEAVDEVRRAEAKQRPLLLKRTPLAVADQPAEPVHERPTGTGVADPALAGAGHGPSPPLARGHPGLLRPAGRPGRALPEPLVRRRYAQPPATGQGLRRHGPPALGGHPGLAPKPAVSSSQYNTPGRSWAMISFRRKWTDWRPRRRPSVHPGRLAASVDLRHPTRRHQGVAAGTEHQLLQTSNFLQVPVPRRREDPLPQPPYVVLLVRQSMASQPGTSSSGPFTPRAAIATAKAIAVIVSNLPLAHENGQPLKGLPV